jgi:hypothetical protein
LSCLQLQPLTSATTQKLPPLSPSAKSALSGLTGGTTSGGNADAAVEKAQEVLQTIITLSDCFFSLDCFRSLQALRSKQQQVYLSVPFSSSLCIHAASTCCPTLCRAHLHSVMRQGVAPWALGEGSLES